MAREVKPHTPHTFKDIWKHPATYVMSVIYLCLVMALTGLLFWMPQLIKSAGVVDTLDIGQLGGIIALFMVGRVKDLTGTATPALYMLCAVCVLAAALIIWGIPDRYYRRETTHDKPAADAVEATA